MTPENLSDFLWGMARLLLGAGLMALFAMWVQNKLFARQLSDHERRFNDLDTRFQRTADQIQTAVTKLADQFDGLQVQQEMLRGFMIGPDGRNGLRSEVRQLQTQTRHSTEQLIGLSQQVHTLQDTTTGIGKRLDRLLLNHQGRGD